MNIVAHRLSSILGCLVMVLASSWAMSADLPDFTQLAESAGRAVVNISTVKVNKNQQPMQQIFPRGPHGQNPFGDFFEQFERFLAIRDVWLRVSSARWVLDFLFLLTGILSPIIMLLMERTESRSISWLARERSPMMPRWSGRTKKQIWRC